MTQNNPDYEETVTFSELSELDQKLHLLLVEDGILDKLTPEQVRAIIPAARGDSISQMAAASDRSDKTIKRWLKDEAFKSAVSATVSCIYSYALRTSAVLSIEAVSLLRDAINDKGCKMSDRLKAASIALELGDRWQNFRLEEKIKELEARIAMRSGDVPDDEDGDEEDED